MATPSVTDTKADDRLRKTLTENARRCAKADRERDTAYADRLALWRHAIDQGWTQARIAEASRCAEGAVTQALRRARLSNR